MIGETVEYFSCSIPEVLVAEWAQSYLHFIGLVELYAILVARMLWPAYIDGSRAIFFIDNKSAMDACIKGTSGSQPVRRLSCVGKSLKRPPGLGPGSHVFRARAIPQMNLPVHVLD